MRRLLIVVLLLPSIGLAAWIDKSGNVLPDSSNRKAIGEFGAQMIFVRDESVLFEQWNTPSNTIDVKTTESVEVNGAINAFVVFSGCRRDTAGNCSVEVRFRVFQPDGSVYAETPAMEVWDHKPAPPGGSLELSVQYLKVVIEPTDQLGTYTIQSQVRDNNSGDVLQLSGPFNAVATKK
jgi:hypothetical protein